MKFPDTDLPPNRKFGFFFTFIFLLMGAYMSPANYSYLPFGIAALFFIVTLVKADLLLPLNKLWMMLGLLLGMIVSPLVLGIIFFGLFTPISLLMKLFGRDELRLKLASHKSYWKERSADARQSGPDRSGLPV